MRRAPGYANFTSSKVTIGVRAVPSAVRGLSATPGRAARRSRMPHAAALPSMPAWSTTDDGTLLRSKRAVGSSTRNMLRRIVGATCDCCGVQRWHGPCRKSGDIGMAGEDALGFERRSENPRATSQARTRSVGMHDIDRTQLESQAFGYGTHGESGQTASEEIGVLESPLNEAQEI